MGKQRFHITTLGCAKNLVDSSTISDFLEKAGFNQSQKQRSADYVIINTCGFIHDAKQESLAEIQKASTKKRPGQKLIVTGCLSERYRESLLERIDGIDGLMGTRDLKQILTLIEALGQGSAKPVALFPRQANLVFHPGAPAYAIQGKSSYLKLADGCRRSCRFCAIPGIKGSLVSRTQEAILEDAQVLQSLGIKEINLIAQDVTDYGVDRGEKDGLASLLAALLPTIPKVPWLRLLYTYPGSISPALFELMQGEPRLLPYLDIPLQHADPDVLRSMGRPSDISDAERTIDRMRAAIPGLVVRTTFITGYPTETDEAFDHLYAFIQRVRFDHLGVFTYSPEEDTPAQGLGDPIPTEVKNTRREALMALQETISLEKNQALIGKAFPMLVEGVDKAQQVIVGRTYHHAPEVDGLVITQGIAQVGDMTNVSITGAMEHDLFGQQIS